jgi:monofunctional biosynthetic peptidoglycan transglycosylase
VRPGAPRRRWWQRLARVAIGGAAVFFACLAYSWSQLPDVRPLRREVPARTSFMRLRESEAAAAGRPLRHVERWMPYARISPTLRRAVLVTEDAAFWDHEGIDFEELRASMEVNWMHGGFIRGGSTITQQLAKNLYLTPIRNPYRKLVELMIARRLEAVLTKARILELYLNLIEWGDGVWGADAAARTYFGVSAANLTREQAALLAAAIINPRLYSPAHPNKRLLSRQRLILARMGGKSPPPPPAPSLEPPEPTFNLQALPSIPMPDAPPDSEN